MRTAITLGFSTNGSAEIITGPEVALEDQKRDFRKLAASGKSDFAQIQLWESGRGVRMRKRFGDNSAVDFNSAHRVEKQQAKGKAKKGKSGSDLPDLNSTGGKDGGVNFNAAHPVHLQQDKKASKHLPDLNELRDKGATVKKSGVNWDAVNPVEDQGKKSSKKSASSAKSAVKKSSASKTVASSSEPAKDEKPSTDGPTL